LGEEEAGSAETNKRRREGGSEKRISDIRIAGLNHK
jgi:hypothetical protein